MLTGGTRSPVCRFPIHLRSILARPQPRLPLPIRPSAIFTAQDVDQSGSSEIWQGWNPSDWRFHPLPTEPSCP
jgi:hypothetical protein